MDTRRWSFSALHAYACGAALLVVVHYLLPRGSGVQGLAYQSVGIAAVAAVVAGIRLRRPSRTLHLWTLAAGLALMAAGDALFNLNEFVLLRSPFPSFADWVYLGAYVLYAAAILLLVRSRQRIGLSDVLDGAIVLTGSGVLFWFALIGPMAGDPNATVGARIVSAAYPAADVLLLVGLSQLVTTRGGGTPAFRLFAAGALALLASDVVYGLQLLEGTYVAGGLLDLGWMASTILWGLAALHPSMATLHLHAPERNTRLTLRRLAVLGGASLVFPFVTLHYLDDIGGVGVIVAGATLTALLVFARMALLFRQHEDAVAALQEERARLAVEEAERVAWRRFQGAAGALECAIYEWDVERDVIHWMDGLDDAFSGVAPTAWWLERIHPDDRPSQSALVEALRARGGETESEYRFLRTDGTYSRILDRWVAFHDADGRLVRVVGGMIDVTHQRELEERLQQAEKMQALGRLAGGIAHDFNNLLTAIAGNAELLQETGPGERAWQEELGEIRRAAGRAAQLTEQLLTFSRVPGTSDAAGPLNETIEGMATMLDRLIGDDVAIELVLDPAVGAVACEPAQIEQIVLNLALNARDAMPFGGSLRVETKAEAGSARVRVTDNGGGMDDHTAARVFEPFFTTKAPGKGTGLGLATVYGIVERSGGAIAVESRPGAGTTFELVLPEAVPAPAAAEHDGVGSDETGTILVVEDEPAVRGVVCRMLRRAGYDVIASGDPVAALTLFDDEGFRPDLVLTDVVMPALSGFSLAHRIEQLRPGTRFVLMTGFAGDARREAGAGTSAPVVQKPFTAEILTAAVRAALAG